MPNIFIFAPAGRVSHMLAPYLSDGGWLSTALRDATSQALGDLENGARDVEIRLMPVLESDNATKIQVFCVGSRTPERAAKPNLIKAWATALAEAWKDTLEKRPEIRDEFPLDKVGIWPTMPEGEWFLASDLCKRPVAP